ncbi:MAG: nicotinate-nucleotide--dimethylbenzimidazole phosphoribosyltransferase [Paracoccus sp. (in: a-proteobacteria)]|nr:nicotinate-nucleotide--dimethylbenzimidazole phosphoribosyltransferase [Paracoccus sp. (in: a-proteobacteria)]
MMQDIDFSSFAALRRQISAGLPQPDQDAIARAQARQASLTKPAGSLGRLEELALFMAGWQGAERPEINAPQAIVFAGNHGVTAQGISPFPAEVTSLMVENFDRGGAAINQLCRAAGARLDVVALDLGNPTADITESCAMTEAETLRAMARGAAALDPDADLLLLGEMGIGNSTIAAALAAALLGGGGADWCGPGTGLDAAGVAHKARVVDSALERARGEAGTRPQPGLETLASLGGREQAAIAGAILAARMARVPVLLDGFICTAAALPLRAEAKGALDHCLAAHCSAEPGHRRALEAIGLRPLLSLEMRLGEGSGAALALPILRAALACHNGMASFAEAGIAGP